MTTRMTPESRVFVAGHRGMVGRAVVRCLRQRGYKHILTAPREQVDFRGRLRLGQWLSEQRPDVVIHAAAVVGGIEANRSSPVEFLQDNLAIAQNVITESYRCGVDRLLFLGSSCIYPRLAPQPIVEEALLTGPLETTNQWYALAKIAGLKLCEAYNQQYGTSYVSLMPTNLYGPHDSFDLQKSHVLPALLRKLHDAKVAGDKTVTVWGSGKPQREFLHVDDLASAIVYVLSQTDATELLNVGSGQETTIAGLAHVLRRMIGFEGALQFDDTKPDGTPRKLLDCSRIRALGWRPTIPLAAGVQATYDWYKAQLEAGAP